MKLLHTDLAVENVYIKQDIKTGLIGIVVLHNTKNGPALGGCRFVSYPSVDAAVLDAINLATAMTYKSSMAGLPLGGGKSVVIAHPGIKDRNQLFESFGEFVEELNGRYITASDSGTNEEDMHVIATKTKHVTSINKRKENNDSTAYMTASGVVKAIEAAVQFKLNKNKLDGVHIAIQGVGSVGFLLTQMLVEKGAKITICDINEKLVHQISHTFGVNSVSLDHIAKIECDIFSPCALGGIVNQSMIETLKAPIICGAANNQLADKSIDEILHQKNILYVPDYVANAGGVICAAAQAGVISKESSYQKVDYIYDSVLNILNLSLDSRRPTYAVANHLAEQLFL